MLHHTGWLVLLVHLPPRPIGLRVRVWRRLKGMGAVALKPSAYVLPDAAEQREQFEWLSQEMEKAGGQATLLQVARIERLSAADLRALFHAARGREYQEVAGKYKALLTRAGRTAPRARAGLDTARRRLAGELARIRRIDFFDAPQYHDVKRLSETLDMH